MKAKLVGIIILVLLFTAILPNYIYADIEGFDINTSNFDEIQNNYKQDSFEKLRDEAKADIKAEAGTRTKQIRETFSLGSALAGAVVAVIVAPVMIVSIVITIVTRGADNVFLKGGRIVNWYTIEDTVFNKIPLFDADYFLTDSNDSDFNKVIKDSVAVFYYITKTVAVLCGLIMLIYLGIRMAISTIASDMAKYKDMLKDWLVSMTLIFLMPYIIGLVNLISGGLVQIFANMCPKTFEQNLVWQVLNLVDQTSGWSYVAVVAMYLVMTFYQIKFFLMYINRMLSMGFLIIISPLITVTYSATKTKISGKGGKAAMFDKWFKEYTVNAFLQPLHAAIYMVFMISAYEIFTVAPLLSVIFFAGLSRAERIVKNILGMRKMSSIHSMSAYMPVKRLKG
ncbi:MAG: hypothetical protein HFJ44_02590 [Clostridia bacterium]|jgi:hypothetical protein|nr:hypothetical protein [Clostridia bacterium]